MHSFNVDLTVNPQESVPRIAILLATYNGERFLEEQLNSFASQTERNWVLWASDDGSTDQTLKILHTFATRYKDGKVNIVSGPKKGFAQNFLSLIKNPKVKAEHYAYADQDDVWLSDKLERAVSCLIMAPAQIAALYCSRTEYVDEALEHIGNSTDFKKPATFANALVQNIASGNTMVFNQAAHDLLSISDDKIEIPLHDWWTYIVIAACGGGVFFDHKPSVLYRQHANNLWGMNTGWVNRGIRVKKLFEGRFRGWNGLHIKALEVFYGVMSSDNRKIMNAFIVIREGSLPLRIFNLQKSGLYRQNLLGNVGLWVGAIFRKI